MAAVPPQQGSHQHCVSASASKRLQRCNEDLWSRRDAHGRDNGHQNYAGHREDLNILVRMIGDVGKRSNLSPEGLRECRKISEAIVHAPHRERAEQPEPEENEKVCDDTAIARPEETTSEADCGAGRPLESSVPGLVWDYPLSRNEKLTRIAQLWEQDRFVLDGESQAVSRERHLDWRAAASLKVAQEEECATADEHRRSIAPSPNDEEKELHKRVDRVLRAADLRDRSDSWSARIYDVVDELCTWRCTTAEEERMWKERAY